VNPHDVLGDRRSPAVRGLGQVRQPWVQGGVAAVAADLEDVVTIGPSRVKVVGPIAEIGNEICDLNVWLQADDPSSPGRELRQGDTCAISRSKVRTPSAAEISTLNQLVSRLSRTATEAAGSRL
jgi:hypothetical protein